MGIVDQNLVKEVTRSLETTLLRAFLDRQRLPVGKVQGFAHLVAVGILAQFLLIGERDNAIDGPGNAAV